RLSGVSTGLFLDQTLDETHDEGHAASLDRLEIARSEASRAIARPVLQAGLNHRVDVAQGFTRSIARDVQGIVAVQQIRDRGRDSGNIEYPALAQRKHRRAVD